jgi:hypothetical protein
MDLQTMLPILSTQEKEWLTLSLQRQFPEGHPWIELIQKQIPSKTLYNYDKRSINEC